MGKPAYCVNAKRDFQDGNAGRRAGIFHLGIQSRTLLTNIQGFAAMLADPAQGIDPERRQEYAEIIEACAVPLGAEYQAFIAASDRPDR